MREGIGVISYTKKKERRLVRKSQEGRFNEYGRGSKLYTHIQSFFQVY